MAGAAIVLAGGRGIRAGTSGNKVYETVGDRSLLSYSLEVCALAPSVELCVLVHRPEDRDLVVGVVNSFPDLGCVVVEGGATRHHSEVAGLGAVRSLVDTGGIDVIAVHDAARPFATVELFERVMAAARQTGGAVPGLGFGETTYEIGGAEPVRCDPGTIVRVQTPQAFRAVELIRAYDLAPEGFVSVDTAQTVERVGAVPVAVVAGEADNIKVTYPEDLATAEGLALHWDRGSWASRR